MAEPSVARQLARLASSFEQMARGQHSSADVLEAFTQLGATVMGGIDTLKQVVQDLVGEVHQATTQIQALQQQLADQQGTEQQLADLEQQLNDARDQLAGAFQAGGTPPPDQGGGTQPPPAPPPGAQQAPRSREPASIQAARAAQQAGSQGAPRQTVPMQRRGPQ